MQEKQAFVWFVNPKEGTENIVLDDMMWYVMIWYDMIWYDMMWHGNP